MLQFIDKITPEEQEKLDTLFARSVFVNNIAHSYSSCPHTIEFLKRLRPSYKAPSPYKLSNR